MTDTSKVKPPLRSHSIRVLMTVVAAVFALLAASAAPAQASHSGDFAGGPPDNATHYVENINLTGYASQATTHGIVQIDRSVMNATYADGPEIDVHVHDAYYGRSGSWAGMAGYANCQEDEWWWDGDCNVYRVRYNLSYAASYSWARWQSLGCHELGHTTGLAHRSAANDTDNNSCMRSTVLASRPRFDSHDIDAINALF
ncbi:hypothetical protein GCM10009830_09440 [Glycomyces endophyticus]|uniref:Matrixin family metalloprotease n=1 Tax=Glycomyces endophyticus TaxID=480996 RepID=A0ABP4S1M1_9ACTN